LKNLKEERVRRKSATMSIQANNIHLLLLCCNECEYQFRSEEPMNCPQCNANVNTPLLTPFQKADLLALVKSNPYRNDRYDNWDYNAYQERMEFRHMFKMLLEAREWYDHSRITMQACWISLFILPVHDHKITFALSFFEDAFANALPSDEAEIEDAISNDIWERRQDKNID
jgi:hypothetical protein